MGTPNIPEDARDWHVQIGGEMHPVTMACHDGGARATLHGKEVSFESNWTLGDPVLVAQFSNGPATFQIDRTGISYLVTHRGVEAVIRVLTPRVAVLAELMPEKEPPDLSKFVLSPMPGLLVSLAVEDGMQVRAGEEVAVVEAMKMENVLRATANGVVKTIHAAPGDSLSVDQAIIEFE